MDTISDVLKRLHPGGSMTFDSGLRDGSITVTRSKRPISVRAGGTSLGEFSVAGVTSTRHALTAGDAQADVGRRRRIRDDAKAARQRRAAERGFGS
jgi:hypothetical protein